MKKNYKILVFTFLLSSIGTPLFADQKAELLKQTIEAKRQAQEEACNLDESASSEDIFKCQKAMQELNHTMNMYSRYLKMIADQNSQIGGGIRQ